MNYLICSYKKDITNFWKKNNISSSNNFIKINKNSIINNLDDIETKGYCYIVEYSNKKYVITSYDNTKNSHFNYLIFKEIKIKLDLVFQSNVFGISILKINNEFDINNNFENIKYYNFNLQDYNIKENNSNLFVNKIVLKNNKYSEKKIKFCINNFFENIFNDNINIPIISYVLSTSRKIYDKKNNVNIISGSMCIDSDNKCIAHISHLDNNNNIIALPVFIIKKLINYYDKTNLSYYDTKIIKIYGSSHKLIDDTDNNKELFAIRPNKVDNITYNMINSNKKNIFKFDNNMYVYGIDSKNLSKIESNKVNNYYNYKIYYDEFNMHLNIENYTLFTNNDSYNINYYNIKSNKKESVDLKPINLNNKLITIDEINDIYIYKNLVFIELNDEIYEKNNLYEKEYFKKLNNEFNNEDKNKIIIMIDILENYNNNKQIKDKIDKFKEKIKNKNYLILEYIENIKITSINSIDYYINSKKENHNFIFRTSDTNRKIEFRY